MKNNMNPNKLINEKSPYLLQHAYNPVNWYPWGEEAFKKAQNENKPIFLSIGYSTCHWCHVMERESFEDKEVADYLNQYYISIKVDKEERPDVDNVYMSVCQLMTGSGGWPLTILMLPSQKPFFAGTYFPKESRSNMIGLLDLLRAAIDKWHNHHEELVESGEEILNYLRSGDEKHNMIKSSPENSISAAYEHFKGAFDPDYGGFTPAPKFPSPHNLMFLLRYAHFEKNQESSLMVQKTLLSMYQGGIYDHIGYGFSRYSTDNKWLVPHFEKMLYDNALLVITYTEAYQMTGNELFRKIAEDTLTYTEREMTDEKGGFYCAQDADSDGEEGKYYTFTINELKSILGDSDCSKFIEFYNITKEGNFEGKNIPNRILSQPLDSNLFQDKKASKDIEYTNSSLNDVKHEDFQGLDEMRRKLYQYRLTRVPLHKDDKVLTSWNSLMITAYAKAYSAFLDEKYLDAAEKAYDFILDQLTGPDMSLMVRWRNGHSAVHGHIDDYAFFVWASLELYQACFKVKYLQNAMDYANRMIGLFYDFQNEGFFHYSTNYEKLIVQPKEIYDGAIPSGNAVAFYCLNLLNALTIDTVIGRTADRQAIFLSNAIAEHPFVYSFSLMGFMQGCYATGELIAVMETIDDAKDLRELLASEFRPELSVMIITDENRSELEKIAPHTASYVMMDGKVTYYLCENHVCAAPSHDIRQLLSRAD